MPGRPGADKGRRPRDELGRPLPRGEINRLPLEDFDRLSTGENDRLGRAYFAAGQYFGAHEAWESCWKQAIGSPEAEGYKGLAQLAAGYVHLQRGNAHGCRALMLADAEVVVAALDEPAASENPRGPAGEANEE
jgi:hypothetical protein